MLSYEVKCKVGDTIYGTWPGRNAPHAYKVLEITINESGIHYVLGEIDLKSGERKMFFHTFSTEDFGDCLFGSSDEAEAALEEEQKRIHST